MRKSWIELRSLDVLHAASAVDLVFQLEDDANNEQRESAVESQVDKDGSFSILSERLHDGVSDLELAQLCQSRPVMTSPDVNR